MAVLLDTDVAIELLRGNSHTLDCLAEYPGDVFVSTITAAELYFGAYHSRQVEKNVRAVDEFLSQFPRLTSSDETARVFGELKQRLFFRSTPVDSFDLLIASIALANGCAVVTGNIRHFEKIEGLSLLNWIRKIGGDRPRANA